MGVSLSNLTHFSHSLPVNIAFLQTFVQVFKTC